MSARPTIKLYYDVVSPYSYLAFAVLRRYRSIWNVNLELKPMFLGGVMQGSGNKPPATNPNKMDYLTSDIDRLSLLFDLPMSFPSTFTQMMRGTIHAQRLLLAVQHMYGGDNSHASSNKGTMLEQCTKELWVRGWERDEDVISEAGLRATLSAVGITSREEQTKLLLLSRSDVIKTELKKNTQQVLENAGFGAPWIIISDESNGIEDEGYFGSDRIEAIAFALKKPWFGPQPSRETIASKL